MLSILLFCLLRPVITTLQVAPQETYLAVLIDDSQSMAIADMPAGQTGEACAKVLWRRSPRRAGREFQIRSFRFDKTAERIAGAEGWANQVRFSIGQALEYVDAQLGGLPLGALIVLTDGVDNSESDPLGKALDLAIETFRFYSGCWAGADPPGHRHR